LDRTLSDELLHGGRADHLMDLTSAPFNLLSFRNLYRLSQFASTNAPFGIPRICSRSYNKRMVTVSANGGSVSNELITDSSKPSRSAKCELEYPSRLRARLMV